MPRDSDFTVSDAAPPAAAHAAPWPVPQLELATADNLPAPPCPTQLFPQPWRTWIERAAESQSAPPGFVAMAALSVCAGLIGNQRWASPWDGWCEPPMLNVALVGNPSSGKSPALDPFMATLTALEAAANEDFDERRREHETIAASAAEREKLWLADVKAATKENIPAPCKPAGADAPSPIARRRIVSTDPTVAKAERLSAANPRGLILFRDELAAWLGNMDRFTNGSGSDRPFWLQAYGGRHWSPDRVKDGDHEIVVPHLSWSVLGGIQPDRLASVLMAGDDDGLASRFLYCWPAPGGAPSRPAPGPGLDYARPWFARLRALPWTPPEPLLLPFTEAAATALQEWRTEVHRMEGEAGGLFLSWVGKLPGFAVRLALVFAHMTWTCEGTGDPPATVDDLAVLRAGDFLEDYAVPMARRAFGEAALPIAERDARTLARWLLRQRPMPATVNVRELRRMRGGPGIGDAPRIEAALAELEALGWCRPAPPREGGPGRNRSDWTLNPALAGGG